MLTMRSPTAWQNGQPFGMNDSVGLLSPTGDDLVAGQFDFLEDFARLDANAPLADPFDPTSTSLHSSSSMPKKSSRPPKFYIKYLTPTRKKSISAGGGGSSHNKDSKENGVAAAASELTSSRRKKKSTVNTDEESLLSCTTPRTRSVDESGSLVLPSTG
ncbi:unnamed protein product [Dibothriocephalus latus]|uniref:Uncharacterized protein n=1 Tax=Dibothriocephalus latus TaxID=60516 RepID=A0A3P7LAF6_DIBLA|nr:unnamed protein product [Dibothriocephalus latus]